MLTRLSWSGLTLGSTTPSSLSLNSVWRRQSSSLIPRLQTSALCSTISCPWTYKSAVFLGRASVPTTSAARGPAVLNFEIPGASIRTLPSGLLQCHTNWNSGRSDQTSMQSVQNTAARLVARARRRDHVHVTWRQSSVSSTGYQCDSKLFIRLSLFGSASTASPSIFTRALCPSGQRPRSSTATICIQLPRCRRQSDSWPSLSLGLQCGTVCHQQCATIQSVTEHLQAEAENLSVQTMTNITRRCCGFFCDFCCRDTSVLISSSSSSSSSSHLVTVGGVDRRPARRGRT